MSRQLNPRFFKLSFFISRRADTTSPSISFLVLVLPGSHPNPFRYIPPFIHPSTSHSSTVIATYYQPQLRNQNGKKGAQIFQSNMFLKGILFREQVTQGRWLNAGFCGREVKKDGNQVGSFGDKGLRKERNRARKEFKEKRWKI